MVSMSQNWSLESPENIQEHIFASVINCTCHLIGTCVGVQLHTSNDKTCISSLSAIVWRLLNKRYLLGYFCTNNLVIVVAGDTLH